jgi:pimeloyl-ACP methyl ester carboxylesterase
MFLGGFMSDMEGTKAQWLEGFAAGRSLPSLRFDYSGHGRSEGAFTDGTIGAWLDDALAVFDRLTEGPQVLAGSSMGSWIALLLALRRPERVQGIVGIAAAPVFTEDLIHRELDDAQRAALMRDGILHLASEYSETPYPITRQLIEEGRNHLLLDAPIAVPCPVHMVHGLMDSDVPWQTATRIAEKITRPQVTVTFIDDGDHRLSREADLARIGAALDGMIGSGLGG